MKKGIIFLFSALMICAAVGVFVGCADSSSYEPDGQTQKREQFKEKLSHEVTQVEAREHLEKFLTKLNIPSTRGGDTKLPPITSVYTTGKAAEMTRAGEEVEPYFHIFNFGDNEGFAIMSGDDRVEPLLALTFQGEFTPETEIENPGFEIAYSRMEDYYIERIGIADTIPSIQPDLPIPPRDTIPLIIPVRDTTIYSTEYFDLPTGPCPVEWGQTIPYYKFCFVPGTYNNACTGCAAVALAQLMSIYKHPSSYTGYIYHWDEMNLYTCKYITNPYVSDVSKSDQIAHLMRHLGLSENLDMAYGEDVSYANVDRVLPTLLNFGYTNGRKISYDTTDVTDELKNGYPVLIYGFDGYNNGHMWLGHGEMERTRTYIGYNEFDEVVLTNTVIDKYILCNWGWDGNDNGYFLSGVFDASEDSIYPLEDITRSEDYKNFEYNLNAFINIRKQ